MIRGKPLQQPDIIPSKVRREEQRKTCAESPEGAASVDASALPDLYTIGRCCVPKQHTAAIVVAFCQNGKDAIARRSVPMAAAQFQAAQDMEPGAWPYRERSRVATRALQPGTPSQNVSLIQLKEALQLPCQKAPCLARQEGVGR